MQKFTLTGGARIGMANATWPFARLSVSKYRLELNASLIGNLVFQPEDIISIDTFKMIPFLGQGIKINHRVSNYNSNVIFWTFKSPAKVLKQIKQTGFLDNYERKILETESLLIKEQQQIGSFPIKKSVAIVVIALWNILLIYDFIYSYISNKQGIPLGIGSIIALGTLLLISLLSLSSNKFSKLVLKEGKSIQDINKFLYLLIFISSLMLLGMLTFKNV